MSAPATGLETQELLGPVGGGDNSEDDSKVVGKSPTRLALQRFRHDKLSMVAFAITALYILIMVGAPLLVHFNVLHPLDIPNTGSVLNADGLPKAPMNGISWEHPFGLEPGIGRDIFARLLYGISWSMGIGIFSALITLVIGGIVGIVAGMSAGIVDSLLGRFMDVVLSFPSTLMLLAFSGSTVGWMQSSLGISNGDIAQSLYVICVLALFSWPVIARIVRGQVLSIREREYIESAKLIGASRGRLYFREVLPNLWAPLLVYFTLTVPLNISAEAALNFLGVGVKPPTPTLGNILNDGVVWVSSDFLFFLIPGLALAIIVIAFNLTGDGLRDALDPRSNR